MKDSYNNLTANRFERLKKARLACSTRIFKARGASVLRCDRCALAMDNCICEWRPQLESEVDFVLILHADEVFKPTNTGRLVADVFPAQTYAFIWDRTAPDEHLLALLTDPSRHCVLLFPTDGAAERQVVNAGEVPLTGKRLTLVVLDGTWKQARKMFKTAVWLRAYDCLALNAELPQTQYSVRKAIRPEQLSTAEAVVAALGCLAHPHASVLADYFTIFNTHYQASRWSVQPETTAAHLRLSAMKAPQS